MHAPAWKLRAVRVVATVVVATGVGAAPGCDPCEGVEGPFTAELGTGVDGFAPLPETGASLPYVRGLQGGTHVDGAVRVTGLFVPPPEETRVEELPQVAFTLHDGDTLVGGFSAAPRTFEKDGDAFVHAGEPVIFFQDASAWVGTTLRLFVSVQDRCEHRVEDERPITIRDAGT